MDMPIKNGKSRYYNPPIKRKELLEPKDVEIGYEFVLRLITLRLSLDEVRPSTQEERQARFKRDKNVIARQMGYDSYVALPSHAKAFESRCAAVKKVRPDMDLSSIAKEERLLNEKVSQELFISIQEILSFHAEQVDQKERIRRLFLRMCRYNKN